MLFGIHEAIQKDLLSSSFRFDDLHHYAYLLTYLFFLRRVAHKVDSFDLPPNRSVLLCKFGTDWFENENYLREQIQYTEFITR